MGYGFHHFQNAKECDDFYNGGAYNMDPHHFYDSDLYCLDDVYYDLGSTTPSAILYPSLQTAALMPSLNDGRMQGKSQSRQMVRNKSYKCYFELKYLKFYFSFDFFLNFDPTLHFLIIFLLN